MDILIKSFEAENCTNLYINGECVYTCAMLEQDIPELIRGRIMAMLKASYEKGQRDRSQQIFNLLQ